jgi:hypothetical protein
MFGGRRRERFWQKGHRLNLGRWSETPCPDCSVISSLSAGDILERDADATAYAVAVVVIAEEFAVVIDVD